MDILLRDPAIYDPNHVADARELLGNWEAQARTPQVIPLASSPQKEGEARGATDGAQDPASRHEAGSSSP